MPRPARPRISETVLSDEPLSPEETAHAVGFTDLPIPADTRDDAGQGDQHPTGDPPGHQPADPAPSAPPEAPKPKTVDGATTYHSRIAVQEAFQYTGNLTGAPSWIDRNWAAWDDGGQLQGQPAGPALRVPVPSSPYGEKLCRRGDYVVRQEVTMIEGVTDVAIEVWPKDEFERLFIPRRGAT